MPARIYFGAMFQRQFRLPWNCFVPSGRSSIRAPRSSVPTAPISNNRTLISQRAYSSHAHRVRKSQYIFVGEAASQTHTFTEEEVKQFADIVGDYNPVHFDEEYVIAQGKFKSKVVHGILLGSLFNTIAMTKLPGPGSTILSQKLIFVKPAYIGDTVTATLTLSGAGGERSYMFFDAHVTNAETGELLVTGSALIRNHALSALLTKESMPAST